jgi:hypothetical protein
MTLLPVSLTKATPRPYASADGLRKVAAEPAPLAAPATPEPATVATRSDTNEASVMRADGGADKRAVTDSPDKDVVVVRESCRSAWLPASATHSVADVPVPTKARPAGAEKRARSGCLALSTRPALLPPASARTVVAGAESKPATPRMLLLSVLATSAVPRPGTNSAKRSK